MFPHKTARRRFCFLELSEKQKLEHPRATFLALQICDAPLFDGEARCRYCRSDPDDNNKSGGIYKEKVSIFFPR